MRPSTGFYLFIVFNCDSKLIYRSLGFFFRDSKLACWRKCWRQPVVAYNGGLLRCAHNFSVETEGTLKLFSGYCIFVRVVKITFLETAWNIGLIGQKNFFAAIFCSFFFKFSTPILAKLRQCSASFWHFEASMHAFMIVCESAKISKKYENFQNLRNFDFFPNFFSRLICIKGLEYDWILLHARLFV